MIRGDGMSWESRKLYRFAYRIWFRLRQAMVRDIEIRGGSES